MFEGKGVHSVLEFLKLYPINRHKEQQLLRSLGQSLLKEFDKERESAARRLQLPDISLTSSKNSLPTTYQGCCVSAAHVSLEQVDKAEKLKSACGLKTLSRAVFLLLDTLFCSQEIHPSTHMCCLRTSLLRPISPLPHSERLEGASEKPLADY